MLSAADRYSLLNAVPSFAPKWEAWSVDQADYVSRFPNAGLTDAQHEHEFLGHLARHLAERIAVGERHEVAWLFAALEPLLAAADESTRSALTVGFLESLIYSVEEIGADAAFLGTLTVGAETRAAWRAAFEYIHPPGETESEPREA